MDTIFNLFTTSPGWASRPVASTSPRRCSAIPRVRSLHHAEPDFSAAICPPPARWLKFCVAAVLPPTHFCILFLLRDAKHFPRASQSSIVLASERFFWSASALRTRRTLAIFLSRDAKHFELRSKCWCLAADLSAACSGLPGWEDPVVFVAKGPPSRLMTSAFSSIIRPDSAGTSPPEPRRCSG